MKPIPNSLNQYHVFLASPGDVGVERQHVRKFFDDYNRHTAHIWRARFEVVDWENYSTVGVGRPQELVTRQTLEKYKQSLALVIGIMSQRFGSPTGAAESGTEEEFNWAMDSHRVLGFPDIKWFFRKVDKLEFPSDPDEAEVALDQWKKVRAFRKRMQDLNNPIFYAEYPSSGFAEVFERDLKQWLADPARPWAMEMAAHIAATAGNDALILPVEFDAERYRNSVLKRFDKLNFEMLDTTGAFYCAVKLWSVFVPQSVRECHQYNPRLLEIPKDHQRRLLDAGDITAKELEEAEQQADRQRQEYFRQPLRLVLDVMDDALGASPAGSGRKLVILGDPGSGKSSLIRYLALRWASIADLAIRNTQPIPLVVELGAYARWACDGRKDFIRYFEEGPVWYSWPRGLLGRLLARPGRILLLLDGLDEVFDVKARGLVVNDIQRFVAQFSGVPVVLTSRVVGYQAQSLREAGFQHFMLQDLDAAQITDFMRRWHEVTFDNPIQASPKRDRLQKAIRESKSIAMLAGNPLLLTMMAILNRNQELPRDRSDLYAQASRVLLHQWDTERALEDFPGMSNEIGLREKTDILRRVAAHMQAGPGGLKGNLIDGPTLTSLIESYLQSELHFPQARAAARAVVEQFRQRNFILCFVGADSYSFVHRTFLEYFCATNFVHQFNIAKALNVDDLIALFDEHCRDDEWREVLRLICGQIDDQFVGRIVERLATRVDLKRWDGVTPLPELPLAIGCLSEVRNPSRLEATGGNLVISVARCFLQGLFPPQAFVFDLVAAGREMGTRWPGKNAFAFVGQYPKSDAWYHHWQWPHFVAAVFEQRQWIEILSLCGSWDVRRGSVEVLAEKWPDQAARDLLAQRAVQDEVGTPRSAALQALAEKWPDQITRDLVAQCAVQDENEDSRSTALQVLAEKWPDQATRDLVAQCAVQDEDGTPRSAALQVLVEKWADQATRNLVAQRAVQDEYGDSRSTALQVLAEKWPDQATRDLIAQRAVQDEDGSCRSTALRELAKKWPDQTTRDLVVQRAVQDEDGGSRSAALRALVEKWPDQATRDLLAQRAAQDEWRDGRRTALQALAEKWPDQAARDLLTRCAVQDEDSSTRSDALKALAEKWPDQITRNQLAQRAVRDNDGDPRSTALQSLAEKWPDQTTRGLLTRCAVQDEDGFTRSAALQALAERWPDQTTSDLLVLRAIHDKDSDTCRVAMKILAEKWPNQATRDLLTQRAVEGPDFLYRGAAFFTLATMHSAFGRILSTRDLDGIGPYLDPLEPIPRDHIEQAAARVAIRPDDIKAELAALSAHLGWDVVSGAKTG